MVAKKDTKNLNKGQFNGNYKPKTITIRKNLTWGGEYRVPGKRDTEASACYSDDKEEAVETAKAIHGKNVIIKFRSVWTYD